MAKKKTKEVVEEVVTPVVETPVVKEAPKTEWQKAVERANNRNANK
jgi:hypothetical protein